MKDGFDKIDIKSTSMKKKTKSPDAKVGIPTRRRRGKISKWLIPVLIVIFIALGFTGFQVSSVYRQGKKTQASAELAIQTIRDQNIDAAKDALITTKEDLTKTRQLYAGLLLPKYTPIVRSYYLDGEHLMTAADAGLDAGIITTEAIIPYADLLGLKGESKFVSGSADERIQTAVQTLDKLTPKLGDIAEKIKIVNQNFDKINPNRYPEKIGNREIRPKLLAAKTTINNLSELFLNARPLLENLPSLLGEPTPKRYLIIFQNDKELRPTGGFITAYAIFKLEKGKPIVETADDIYKLDEKNTAKISPPEQFIKNLKVFNLNLRDSNFDPDFKDSMQRFEEMYNNIPGTTPVDGVIAVDTHVLVEAMKILGPIPAYGTNFTVDIDPRCDCPQVIYELEDYAGRRVAYIREDRKDIIGVLLYQIMQKALGVSPSQYWGKLFQMVLSEFEQKHILVYLTNTDAQQSLEALNFAGRMIDSPQEDYLHINDANLGGAKSNLFVRQSVKQDFEKQGDGSIVKTVTISYKNPEPGSPGCNLEAGGLCLNGPMKNWLRVYVPKGSELIDFEGSSDAPIVSEAYNRTLFEGLTTVNPEGVATVTIKYKLPQSVSGDKFSEYIQKQPGTDNNEYITLVNGNEVDIFNLTKDTIKEIKL
ncbi:DUF4012 domain-containing protein [Candidatus Gottesmanbacteria bacterium]|nr:DUF4012 domain-containing protein [Candidatus Gottesmanbacteria bacterium]